MELQFKDAALRCLRQSAADTRNVEQTLELRLPENMPPIGRVLGVWGQPLLRGKEWRAGRVSTSGGVMAQVLYEAQDGSSVERVEGWLPFQLQWELNDSQMDGSALASCLLRSVDARQVGAEKLMIRATVSAAVHAYEPKDHSYWMPAELPTDVHLLAEACRLCLPVEAGERPVFLEEDLVLPPGKPDVEKLLYYQLSPVVHEKKVLSDKLLFRATAQLHAVYLGTDGMLHAFDTQFPVSQFAELEREYGQDAQLTIEPAVTDLELERLEDGRMHLKAGMLGQYIVYDFVEFPVTLDAYSHLRKLEMQKQSVQLPKVSSPKRETADIFITAETGAEHIVDCSLTFAQPQVQDGTLVLEGAAQMLYYDENSCIQTVSSPFRQALKAEIGEGQAQTCINPILPAQTTAGVGGISASANAEVDFWVICEDEQTVISALSLGEAQTPDADRPSLILRRAGDLSLWELAKASGSTVEAISIANGLSGELEHGRMLLIPVI